MTRPLAPLARLGLAGLRARAPLAPLPVRAFSASAVSRYASPSSSPTPDYSKGPSALDKAAQVFFFTEIVRGECSDDGWELAWKSGRWRCCVGDWEG